ncbi:MAG: hypothetical protein V4498_09420 [candidate division FCPU426 bacterium]
MEDLAARVVQHRIYKKLPRATLDEAKLDIERQICTRLTARECISEGTDDEWKPIDDNPNITMSAVIGASKAALEFVASGAELVPEAERARRAEICLGCAANSFIRGCRCSIFYKMIDRMVPAIRRDPGLGVCGVCACSLQAKTNLPANVIVAGDKGRNLEYPSFCWIPKLKE